MSGVDQHLAKPARLTGAAAPRATKTPSTKEIPLPPGFRNAPPCSPTYAKKLDSTDPPYGAGYPNPLPYAVCGYPPPQLQGAYGLTSQIAAGRDGKGVTVAIVDAYVSPTLRSDAQEYSAKHQPGQPLKNAQFSELLSKSFNTELCEASEWHGEQTLDVEAVHATAPGAKVLYVGAKNCVNGLYDSVQQVVDGHLAQIITNSWGDGGGDLLDSPGSRRAFDNVLMMANATGIGVQFSSGDEGDEFTTLGMTVADYPASSPYQTAVGGTSLASPLFAGEMALANKAAGGALGFVNPLLYKLAASPASGANAFYDVVPAGKQALVRSDYLNGIDAKEGTLTSVRTLGYEGRETFCSGTGNCTHQRVALSAARGFDSMTGLGSPAPGLPTALAKP